MIMKHRRQQLSALTIGLLLPLGSSIALAGGNSVAANDTALRSAITGDWRQAKSSARDHYRHPYETLKFFQLEDNMTVAEIWPGGGWYSDILAPYLSKRGKFYAVLFDKNAPERFAKIDAAYKTKLETNPDTYGSVKFTYLDNIAPVGSLDRVLTFRNLHNWMAMGTSEKLLTAMHLALKPGGMLGVIDHRLNGDTQIDPKATNGYVSEAHAIKLIETIGFEFVGKSEINANAKDSKDYPIGVWNLLPRLRGAGKEPAADTERYRMIGESDRFTLLFRKLK